MTSQPAPKSPVLALFAAFAVAALVLVSCGRPVSPGAEPGGDADGSVAARLLGRGFETTGAGDVDGVNLAAGSTLTLSFYRDHDGAYAFGGGVGCNSMGGRATWDGDTVRAADGFARTEMFCDGLMEQEDWWSALLTAGVTLQLAGDTLTVTAPSDGGPVTNGPVTNGPVTNGPVTNGPVTIRMTDSVVLHPDLPLEGTAWRLDGIISGFGRAEGHGLIFRAAHTP